MPGEASQRLSLNELREQVRNQEAIVRRLEQLKATRDRVLADLRSKLCELEPEAFGDLSVAAADMFTEAGQSLSTADPTTTCEASEEPSAAVESSALEESDPYLTAVSFDVFIEDDVPSKAPKVKKARRQRRHADPSASAVDVLAAPRVPGFETVRTAHMLDKVRKKEALQREYLFMALEGVSLPTAAPPPTATPAWLLEEVVATSDEYPDDFED